MRLAGLVQVAAAAASLALTLATNHSVAAPTDTLASSSSAATAQAETIHTTANHPWLTGDRGWVVAGDLKPGDPVVTLTGATGTVVWVHTVAGRADMYNLAASRHTASPLFDRADSGRGRSARPRPARPARAMLAIILRLDGDKAHQPDVGQA
jgi:hypothetical protein